MRRERTFSLAYWIIAHFTNDNRERWISRFGYAKDPKCIFNAIYSPIAKYEKEAVTNGYYLDRIYIQYYVPNLRTPKQVTSTMQKLRKSGLQIRDSYDKAFRNKNGWFVIVDCNLLGRMEQAWDELKYGSTYYYAEWTKENDEWRSDDNNFDWNAKDFVDSWDEEESWDNNSWDEEESWDDY